MNKNKKFLFQYLLNDFQAVSLKELDKVKPIGINNLIDTLMSDFGVTYSNLLKTTNIYVNEKIHDKLKYK